MICPKCGKNDFVAVPLFEEKKMPAPLIDGSMPADITRIIDGAPAARTFNFKFGEDHTMTWGADGSGDEWDGWQDDPLLH